MILMSHDDPSSPAPRRRWRRLSAVAAALICGVLLSGCAGGVGGGASGGGSGSGGGDDTNEEQPGKFDNGSTMAMIQKRGKLIVGIRSDAAPFSSKNPSTGSFVGFDVEIAKRIAVAIFGSQIEGKVDFIELDSRDRERALQQSKVDIAMGRYEITVARKRFVDFAGPYYVAHQEVVARQSETDPITNLLDLNRFRVCTVRASTDVDALKAQAPTTDASMVQDSVTLCATQMQSGAVAAIAADHVDLLSVERQFRNTQAYAVVSPMYDPQPYGIGVPKDETDMRKFLNDTLEKKVSDKWADLYAQTIGSDGRDEQPPVDRY